MTFDNPQFADILSTKSNLNAESKLGLGQDGLDLLSSLQ